MHAPAARCLLRLAARTFRAFAPCSLLLAPACIAQAPGDLDGPEPEPTGQVAFALGTVQDAIDSSCSTTSVFGLSKQIVDEVNCLVPGALSEVPARPNLSNGAATFAYLQTAARDHFVAALDDNPGKTLGVNSMLRTVAQQYLLYAWYLAGTCGIPLAAKPGNSNHEDGLAFDTNDYSAWNSAMSAHSFQWYGSSDAFHFDYVGPGIKDLSGKDVLAFQKLWNLNHPTDLIDEDGAYGPQTEARLKQSPADGFPIGSDCAGPPPLDATFVDQGSDAPADPNGKAHFQVCTGATFHFWFELKNKGSAVWLDANDTTPGHWGRAVRLGNPDDKPDVFTGTARASVSDNANDSVDPKGGDCNDKPGCSRTVFSKTPGLIGKAPATPGIYKTTWRLVDETRGWFGPTMWLDVSVVDCQTDAGVDQQVPPAEAAADTPAPIDATPEDAPAALAEGGPPVNWRGSQETGCTCGVEGSDPGTAPWAAALAACAFASIRRRRRTR